MEVEVNAVIEDTDILYYINEYEQSKVLENIFNECTKEQQQRFISNLDDSYLIEELEKRGFTITLKTNNNEHSSNFGKMPGRDETL